MSKYRISMNGKIYEMEIEPVIEKEEMLNRTPMIPNVSYKNGTVTDPVVHVINPEADRQTNFDDSTVVSPMPGTVIKVMAQVGDVVVNGEPILILEAMKMENEICAPKNGRIKEIFVAAGQTVPAFASLFEMEQEAQ